MTQGVWVADSFDFVNLALGGKLEERLRELRAQRRSIEQIAAHFQSLGFPVSRETIRRWLKRFDLQGRATA